MTNSVLPACRFRGSPVGLDRWECRSTKLVVPTGSVSGDYCRACAFAHPANVPAAAIASTGARSAVLRRLAIGIATAPRPVRTIDTTIAELRRAGFHQRIHVFAEPGSDVAPAARVRVYRHARRLGLWHNRLHAARYLLDRTNAEYLLLCEDDLLLCPAASAALARGLMSLPRGTFGMASLYTPLHNVERRGPLATGWHAINRGRSNWGALAYCFTRRSLERILATSAVRNHPGPKKSDVTLGAACIEAGLRLYLHVPSLAAHAGGGISSVGHADRPGFAAVGFDPHLTERDLADCTPVPGSSGQPLLG